VRNRKRRMVPAGRAMPTVPNAQRPGQADGLVLGQQWQGDSHSEQEQQAEARARAFALKPIRSATATITGQTKLRLGKGQVHRNRTSPC